MYLLTEVLPLWTVWVGPSIGSWELRKKDKQISSRLLQFYTPANNLAVAIKVFICLQFFIVAQHAQATFN